MLTLISLLILPSGYDMFQFNRDLTTVWFDPWIFPEDNGVPDPYDKLELIQMISTISSRFSRVIIRNCDPDKTVPNTTLELIPVAVAEFNKKYKKQGEPIMEVIMTYSPQLKTDLHTSFDTTLKLANEANLVYNGTVKTLLMWRYGDITDNYLGKLTESLITSREKLSNDVTHHSYQLGVLLTTKYFFGKNHHHMQNILNLSDVAYFNRWPKLEELSSGFELSLNNSIDRFTSVKSVISSWNPKLPLGFVVSRSDTFSNGTQQYSDLVDFWRGMNNWAVKSSTSIVFHEAFDNFNERKHSEKFYGLWKARDGVYKERFIFQEKGSRSRRDLPEVKVNPIPFENFSRTHLGVTFEPWVTSGIGTNSIDEAGLTNMLNLVATKFTQVLIRDLSPKDIRTNNSLALVPKVAAKINQLQTSSTSKPMSLNLRLSFSLLDSRRDKENITCFQVAKRLADEANSIHPGTVSMLMLNSKNLVNSKALVAEKTLLYAKAQLEGENKFKYRLGLLLNLSDCGMMKNKLAENAKPLLALVDEVFFERKPTNIELEEGVEDSFRVIVKSFERCVEKVRKHSKSNLSIGLISQWPDTSGTRHENFTALVTFWQMLNGWGVKINTTVILNEAIDNFDNTKDKWLGWWELDLEKGPFRNPSEYKFLEKAQILKKNDIKGNGSGVIITIVIITGFCLLGVLRVIAVYIRRRKCQGALNRVEIKEFFEGCQFGDSSLGQLSNVGRAPYDKNFELEVEQFTLDKSNILGSGNFGRVCQGTVKRLNEEIVAVKMTKPDCPMSSLRGLLFEIKVLSYVGEHENIVRLVGAYTAELSKGKIYVFMELCCGGSLEKHLRSLNKPVDSQSVQSLDIVEGPLAREDLHDLDKWSYEIASGMEFLARKHVVHGDIATRNVLLTEDKTAKISDFGLSRRMYDYTNYIKTQQEPLPWRWMAPEALTLLEFSEKSDVWAFGVMLWEIYSLGAVPYPGLSWTIDFPSQLEQGLRPSKPRYGSVSIYEAMLHCWDINPSSRKSFTEMKTHLRQVFHANLRLNEGDNDYIDIRLELEGANE